MQSSDRPQPFADPPRRKPTKPENGHLASSIAKEPESRSLVGQILATETESDAKQSISTSDHNANFAMNDGRNDSGKASEAYAESRVCSSHSDAAAWYVQPPSGGQYGPATEELLRDWIGEGRVTEECLLWRNGWTEWQPASRVVSELATQSAKDGHPRDRVGSGTNDAFPISHPSTHAVSNQAMPTESLPQAVAVEPNALTPILAEVSQAPRYARYAKRRSSRFAWAMIAFLALAALILLVGLFFLLQNGGLSLGPSRG